MVTDRQVRLLMKGIQKEQSLRVAAAKAGMSEKTARRYRDLGKLPGEVRRRHDWRTRQDPFEEVCAKVRGHLEREPRLEARTLFEALQREHPGQFADGQLRTLQRRVKTWRATEGPAREAYFPQVHVPGRLCESDFTHMTSLGVTLAGRPFAHLVYHFVLTYSSWETGTICFSESFDVAHLHRAQPARAPGGVETRVNGGSGAPPEPRGESSRRQGRRGSVSREAGTTIGAHNPRSRNMRADVVNTRTDS